MRTSAAPGAAGPAVGYASGASSSADDSRLAPALEEYLGALRSGRRPDRSEFLGRHAEVAGPLEDCLDALEFIQSAAFGASRPVVEGVPASVARLGDFQILRELGRGGMGVVYEARQVSLGRRVALKVLPLAAAIDPRQLRRFQIEAQAAAHLHHPHIVPIFAVGNHDGVNYYAMQFIEGRTLADLIRALREADEADAPAVSANESSLGRDARAVGRAIAHLGTQAAEALEHAHGLGVLHRDVNPANLLVDVRGHLWVTDFGLAQFQEAAGPTLSGDLLGTLRYMSPELARAGGVIVDQRTDIYSLGATLYELATLRPAFDGGDREALLRRVALDEPAAPRKLRPSIPRDLETIILKAMAKEPASRYQTAHELADDLRRFLADEPVLARRPTAGQRVAKWARRHRVAVSSASVSLLLAATVASVLLWVEQRRTAHERDLAQRLLAQERIYVPKIYDYTDSLVLTAMGRFTALNQVAWGHEDERLAWGKQNAEYFRKALDYYEALILATRDHPDTSMQQIAAKAHFGLGLTRLMLGQPGVEDALTRSISTYDELIARHPERSDLRSHLTSSLSLLGKVTVGSRGADQAEPLYRRLLTTLRALHDESPQAPEPRDSLVVELLFWAELLDRSGRRADAVPLIEEAIAVEPDRAAALNNLAWILAGRPDLAPHDPTRAVALAERAVKRSPEKPEFWNTLGIARFRAGALDSAIEALERSIALTKGDPEPADQYALAMIHARKGDKARARKYLDRANAARAKGRQADDPDLPHLQAEATGLLAPPAATPANSPKPVPAAARRSTRKDRPASPDQAGQPRDPTAQEP